MKVGRFVSSVVLAAASVVAGTASAAVTLTNADSFSPFVPFGGFDWAPGSAAWTAGAKASQDAFNSGGVNDPGNKFTVYYVAHAVGIIDPLKSSLFFANLDTNANGVGNGLPSPFDSRYEYTIFAAVEMKVTGYEVLPVACFVPPCTKVTMESLGGTFDIRYDTSFDANRVNLGEWTGFNNGVSIISGSLLAGTQNVFDDGDADGVLGFGLNGVVTGQNLTFVSPALIGTRFTSEFQFAQADPGFQKPTKAAGMDIVQDPTVESIFSVDGSQLFFQEIPEPSSMALLGLALLGAGAASRRRATRN